MKKRYIGFIAGGAAAVVLLGGIAAYAMWNGKDIGKEQAKQIAYGDAGISEDDVERVHVLKDWDDGRYVYEIEFVENAYQYDYEIAASNGKILSKEVEKGFEDQNTQTQQDAMQTPTDDKQSVKVSVEAATQMVIDKVAGASSEQVRIELDFDDGIYKYEGELHYGGMEYDFEIDANTGAFLEWTEEKQDGIVD